MNITNKRDNHEVVGILELTQGELDVLRSVLGAFAPNDYTSPLWEAAKALGGNDTYDVVRPDESYKGLGLDKKSEYYW